MINQFAETIQTHTHPFNGPLSGTIQVSRYQKGKTNLDFTEARDSECQRHQLGHMQVCTSLQTDNHASNPPLKFFYRPDALPAAQPTASKHWRQHMLQRNSKETILVSASASLRPLSTSLPSKFHDFPGPNSFSRTFQVVEILQTQFQGPDLRNILRFIVKLS